MDLIGHDLFFSDSEAYTKWSICEKWESFNSFMYSLQDCREYIALSLERPFTNEYFQGLIKQLGLTLDISRAKDYVRINKTHLNTFHKLHKNDSRFWTDRVKDKFNDHLNVHYWSLDHAFSQARPRGINFSESKNKYACEFPAKQLKDKSVLLDRYWWWRELYPELDSDIRKDRYKLRNSKWPKLLIGSFEDNWELSAFIYEMRARMSDRNHWDFFGKPWIQLNYSERAILLILWPPKHIGAYRFRSRPYPDPHYPNQGPDRRYPNSKRVENTEIELRQVFSLLTPNGVIAKTAVQIINAARQEFRIPESGRGHGKPRALPWRGIEFMDLDRFYRLEGLSSSQHNSITNAKKVYNAACKEIGIEP